MDLAEPDRETLRRAASGDGAAFRVLVDAWKGRIHGLCWRMTGNGALSEDMAQEVFLQVYQVLHRYDGERPFAPWMRRVAVNTVLNRLRRERHRPAALDALPEGASSLADPRLHGPPAAAADREEADLVRRGVEDLPADWRMVVALRYQEGMAVQEIADTLDVPVNTVKTRLFRARAVLRRSLYGLREDAR